MEHTIKSHRSVPSQREGTRYAEEVIFQNPAILPYGEYAQKLDLETRIKMSSIIEVRYNEAIRYIFFGYRPKDCFFEWKDESTLIIHYNKRPSVEYVETGISSNEVSKVLQHAAIAWLRFESVLDYIDEYAANRGMTKTEKVALIRAASGLISGLQQNWAHGYIKHRYVLAERAELRLAKK